MNKLTEVEMKILWSSIEDYADLSWLPGEIDSCYVDENREELINFAKEACKNLIDQGYVQVFQRDTEQPFEDKSYKLIPFLKWKDVLEDPVFWSLLPHSIRVYIVSTKAGEEAYFAFKSQRD
jgi:hypothetical protein